MKNDKKILAAVEEIYKVAAYYIDFVEGTNPCAHTDRMLEKLISKAEEVKTLHQQNFEGGK